MRYGLIKTSAGFTLLEVMIATSILAIALVAALGSQSGAISLATRMKFETIAPMLAQGKMAELTALEGDQLDSGEGVFDEPFDSFHWQMAVSSLETGELSAASENIKRLRLTVTWGDQQGGYEYGLTYYLFVPPEQN